jgi:hypothetical protein
MKVLIKVLKSFGVILIGVFMVIMTAIGVFIKIFPHINTAQEIGICIVGILITMIGISNLK